MIIDKSLLFLFRNDLAKTPTPEIVHLGKGDAGRGSDLKLFVAFDGGPATAATVTLSTAAALNADGTDLASPVVIGTYSIAAADVQRGGVVLNRHLPTGCMKFLKLALAGPTSGAVTAGLVLGVSDSPLTEGDWS